MSEFRTSIEINAPPDHIQAILLDVERWPEWTASTTSVRRIDQGPFVLGSRARVQQPKLRPAVWEVTELNDRKFTWVTRSPGVQITAGHLVEPTRVGSRVTLSLKFSGLLAPLVGWLYGRSTRNYVRMEAEGLRQRAETEYEQAC